MADLSVDRLEIELIMRGLNSLDRKSLTDEDSAIRATLAYKLGAATMDIITMDIIKAARDA